MHKRIQGAGVGLRTPHIHDLLNSDCEIPWLEVLADNWFAKGGLDRKLIHAISERYPLVIHSVGLSLGAADPLDVDYLKQIRQLKQETGALWYSEHCSFSAHDAFHMPDLLPMPYTEEAVRHISSRIRQAQDFLQERMLLENVSSYVQYDANEMREGEFMRAITEEADCYLLLDLNNCHVSEVNNHEMAQDFLNDIPLQRVKQIHLAGFEDKGHYLLDAHNNPVADAVWELFAGFIHDHGPIPAMIEWDNDIPPFAQLLTEQQQAQAMLDQASQQKPAGNGAAVLCA